MKTLTTQPVAEKDYSDIEKQLKVLFYELIFKPIVSILAPHNAQVRAAKKDLRNAKPSSSPVVTGLLSGKVQYEDGTFSGDFSAAISRSLRGYGAKYNKRDGTFTIVPELLPVDILEAAAEYGKAAKDLHDEVMRALDEVQSNLEKSVSDNPVDARPTVDRADDKFSKKFGDALGIDALSDSARASLAKKYSDNLKPYIRDFSDEMVADLRAMVTENAKKGYRFDHLVTRIQNRYDVSQSKAEFLAQQETSMYVSQARQVRFGEVGITRYVWDTAGDSRVRPEHKKLNGQIFEYSKPPVVDASGRRANPGEDFRCRCVANPILPGVTA